MALTGWADGRPLAAPGAPASMLRAALATLRSIAGCDTLPGVQLLGERAAALALSRRAPRSPGGGFQPLRAADGWVGLTLSRPWDFRALPALLERESSGDPWTATARWAAQRSTEEVVKRARLLDLACAKIPERPAGRPSAPFDLFRCGPPHDMPDHPTVVDLTSLWAGPLCAHLLGLCGARIIKVESTQRPDGARRAAGRFFDLLHGGHESVALDLTLRTDIEHLRGLLCAADIVLEGSRPRALDHLGIDARKIAANGGTWVSITAYGRGHQAVGFGDDVAAGGGLVAYDGARPTPAVCGDALADPLSGAVAALGAFAAARTGGACILDVAMIDVAAWAAGAAVEPGPSVPAEPPRSRPLTKTAPPLGRDTRRVLSELT